MRNFISPIIIERGPSFLKSEYKKFYDFISLYWEFLEQTGNPLEVLESFFENTEAHHEAEIYIDKILRDLGFDYNVTLSISKSLLVMHLRDFYLSRGSEKSFKFLFRLFFNADVTIDYPRKKLLTASMASYSRRFFIFTSATQRNEQAYREILQAGDKFNVLVTGVSSHTTCGVESIHPLVSRGKFYLKIQIDSDLHQFFPYEGVEISIPESNTKIIESIMSIVDLDISNRGSGYAIGDQIKVSGCGANGRVQVKTLVEGSIQNLIISNPGTGYQIGDTIVAQKTVKGHSFSAIVYRVGNAGEILKTYIMSPGYNYDKLPLLTIRSGAGTGGIITASSSSIGKIETLEFLEPYVDVISTDNIVLSIVSEQGSDAVLMPRLQTIFKERSSFKSYDGFISSNCTLLDSRYFQQFSYEVKSELSRNDYDNLVDDLEHPVGFIRFSILENFYNETIPIGEGYDNYSYLIVVSELYNALDFDLALNTFADTFSYTLQIENRDDALLVNSINNLDRICKVSDNFLDKTIVWIGFSLDLLEDNSHQMNSALEAEVAII
jgi:hypothetical protein